MTTLLFLEEDVEIPLSIQNLMDFRQWALSAEFPERGRFDYIDGRLEIDLSPRDIFCHGAVMTELVRVLANHATERDSGLLLMSRVRVSMPTAGLSVQPDIRYCNYETIESGKARLVPDPSGKRGRYVELEGPVDLIVEIIDDASETKDTRRLPPAYFAAGVKEFWLVDARRRDLSFQIHQRGETAFQAVVPDQFGFQPSQVFNRRFILQRDSSTPGHWEYDLESKQR